VLRHSFKSLMRHRVEANVQPENTASIALVRLGGLPARGYSPHYLKIAGRWRDHERWAILHEEWAQVRQTRAPDPRGEEATSDSGGAAGTP
jgi:[ribosomal protein S5]-alanine N-acetyltransferase